MVVFDGIATFNSSLLIPEEGMKGGIE